jgi:hypothetical protein
VSVQIPVRFWKYFLTRLSASKKKFRTILRRFSDLQDYQELLSPLCVRLSKASIFEFGIAGRE